MQLKRHSTEALNGSATFRWMKKSLHLLTFGHIRNVYWTKITWPWRWAALATHPKGAATGKGKLVYTEFTSWRSCTMLQILKNNSVSFMEALDYSILFACHLVCLQVSVMPVDITAVES